MMTRRQILTCVSLSKCRTRRVCSSVSAVSWQSRPQQPKIARSPKASPRRCFASAAKRSAAAATALKRQQEAVATTAKEKKNKEEVNEARQAGTCAPPNAGTSGTSTKIEFSTGNDEVTGTKTLIGKELKPKKNHVILHPPTSAVTSSSWEQKSDDFSSLLMFDQQQQPLHQLMPTAPVDWKGFEPTTPLTEVIMSQIALAGRPMSTADFMRLALTHPQHGYYIQRRQDDNDDDFDSDEPGVDAESSNDPTGKRRNTIFGPGGDFVTAPEVSQVFGECLGVWFFTQWQQQQQQNDAAVSPKNQWQWLECGPGRGSLMVDLMQFMLQLSPSSSSTNYSWSSHQTKPNQLHPFAAGCRAIHLVEASPLLRRQQRQALTEFQQRIQKTLRLAFEFHGDNDDKTEEASSDNNNNNNSPTGTGGKADQAIAVHWHDSLGAFQTWQAEKQESLPTFCICQEFLDALPVYSFEKTSQGHWRERLVDVALHPDMMVMGDTTTPPPPAGDQQTTIQNGPRQQPQDKLPRLRIVLAPEATPALRTLLQTNNEGHVTQPELEEAPVGSIVESSPESILVVQDLAAMVSKSGGAALVIDYGQEGSADSLRGFSKHQQVHFLSRPGQVDVTADVDFAALRHVVNNNHSPPTQSDKNESAQSTTSVARAFGPTTQGEFLAAMGIQERVIQLIERDDVTDQQAEDLYNAMVRLASHEEMGERYKVLCITQTKSSDEEIPPPGFSNCK